MRFVNVANSCAVIAIAASLLGCTTYYRHPSKLPSQFDADKSACVRESTRQVCTPYGSTSTTTCERNYAGALECVTNHTPGGSRCNEEADHQKVKSCLERLGWRESDSEGRNTGIFVPPVPGFSKTRYSKRENCLAYSEMNFPAASMAAERKRSYDNCMSSDRYSD
jgi:hypothetical protein